ncbi:MAG: glycosyltransferase [Candidatus Cyclobacteriaceae bacterium M3_2C_046]
MLLSIIFYIFIATLGIMLAYLFRYIFLLSQAKPTQENPDHHPPVSLVVCARNELDNLKILLPQLYQQEYPDFEIIIVDDQSSDESYDYLREEKDKVKHLKVVTVEDIPPHVNGKKYGVTLGIRAAKNDIILLTDADCYPATKHWIRSMAQAYRENDQIILGYSPYQKKKGLLNKFIAFETLFTGIQYLGEAIGGNPYMGVGRNLSYRKALFLEKKGFNKHLKVTGGDDDLFINAHAYQGNTGVAIGPDALVYSYPKTSWKDYFRQKKRHLSVGKLYRKRDKRRIGLYSLARALQWISFVILILAGYELYFVFGGYLLRILVLLILFNLASKKLADKLNIWTIPLMDLLYMIYLITIGVSALFTKKIKWN